MLSAMNERRFVTENDDDIDDTHRRVVRCNVLPVMKIAIVFFCELHLQSTEMLSAARTMLNINIDRRIMPAVSLIYATTQAGKASVVERSIDELR